MRERMVDAVGGAVRLLRGDITAVPADAIVCADNSSLVGGGGVAGAIHRAAGPALQRECSRIGGCPTGDARMTGAGDLRQTRFVIHAVGPIWSGGWRGEAELLASAYRASMALADQHQLTSIAFPSISTGIYGYPVDQAAPIALQTALDFLSSSPAHVRQVLFVLFDDRTFAAYERALAAI